MTSDGGLPAYFLSMKSAVKTRGAGISGIWRSATPVTLDNVGRATPGRRDSRRAGSVCCGLVVVAVAMIRLGAYIRMDK